MKTLFKFSTTIALFMVFSSHVLAEEALNIGAVQVLKVLEQSPQYQAAGKALDKEFEARSKTLIAEQKKIKGLEDKLSKDRAIMSEAEVGKLERDVLNKKRDLKRDQDEFREDINFRRNEELAKIQKIVFEAVQKVSKDNGYDIVLSEGVVFASAKADMTQLVIDVLNKK